MKLFGTLRELVAAVFRKDGFEVTLRPNQSTTYSLARDVQLPQQDSDAVLVSRNSADTLTNKTIDATGNTLSNISNSNISATAAIAYSKLASLTSGNILVGSATNVPTSTAVTGDVTISNTGVTAIATGVIVNADINASAGISFSKLASLTSGNILVGSATNVPTSTAVSGDITISNTGVTAISSGVIVDGDISASAAISDTKLGTISTAGKVSNSATTATDLNTASAIVARDASGNFSAGTITATSFSGPLTGNVTGNVSGTSANVTGTVAIANGGTGQTTQQAAINALVGTQTANRVLRSNGTNMSLSQVALGTDVSGTLPIANGGTGQTTQQAALTALAGTQVSGQYLRSNGTNTLLSAIQAADVPTLNQNTTGTAANVTGTVAIANGGTGATTAANALTNLGAAATSGKLSQFAATTSAELAGVISDETGSGSLVFGTSPTLSAPQVNSSLVVQRIATPSNPSAGFDKIYTKSDGLLYKLDSAGNEVAVGSGTGGGGELNLVLNPDGDTALNGSRTNGVGDWVDFGTGTTSSKTTTAAEIPLSPLKTNAIKVLNDGSGTDYTRMRMTLPQSLYNRKLKIAWEQEASSSPAYVSGDYKVEIWATTDATYATGLTKLALSTDASGVSSIPALTGKYQTTFDTSTVANLELRIVRVAGAVNSFLSLNNVTVGPGIQPQGAVVQGPISYAPSTDGFGTVSSIVAFYSRRGSFLKVEARFNAGTVNTNTAFISLPSGLDVDTSAVSANVIVGKWWRNTATASTRKTGAIATDIGVNTNILRFVSDDYTTGSAPGTNLAGNAVAGTGEVIWVEFEVPVAEWAGSGTLTVAQNDVEYAWNSDPGTTAGTTYSNSAYYGYGPNGTPIVAINSTTTTGESKTLYTVQFQTPVQAGDQVVVELNDGNGWFNSAQRFATITNNAASYGVAIIAVNSTTYRVAFGNAGYGSSGAATYGAAGGAWSAVTSWRWRVRKSSAGAAVGFGIVSPGTSAGLVSAAGLPGNTTGSAIASGYVGENYSFQTGSNVAVTTAWNNVLTMSNLPAGVWLLTGMAELNNAGSVTGFNLAISAFAGTTTTDHVRGVNQLPCSVPANTGGSITIANWLVNISTPASYYLKANSVGASSTLNCSLRAIRIA